MARYFEFLSQFYGFHLTHPRILHIYSIMQSIYSKVVEA
jgi:hypothetical protein